MKTLKEKQDFAEAVGRLAKLAVELEDKCQLFVSYSAHTRQVYIACHPVDQPHIRGVDRVYLHDIGAADPLSTADQINAVIAKLEGIYFDNA